MSYFSSIKQNVVADPNNSSTTNLSGDGIFTGTSTSTLGIVGIQVSLKTDQNCTVYVDQSPDGTNWDINDEYDYYASINNFGVTTQAINSYLRVRVQNLSSSPTTYFRLQTALCPIVEALPRSLSHTGALKTEIVAMEDHYGFSVENTPMDEMRVVTPYRLVGAAFSGLSGDLDTSFWTAVSGTDGFVALSGGQAIMQTGTSADNVTSISSVRRGRYVSGSSNRYRAVIRLPDTGIADNVRRWGAFDSSDGAFFELSGSMFSCVTRKSAVDTRTTNGNFNGVLGSTIDITATVATYEMYWTNSKVYFVRGGNLLHTMTASTDTWTNTVSLPIRMENYNVNGSTTDVGLDIRVASIARLGQGETESIYRYISATGTYVLKKSAGKLHTYVNTDNVGSMTLYDGLDASSPVIAIIDTSKVLGGMAFDTPFFNGLTVVSTLNAKGTIIFE